MAHRLVKAGVFLLVGTAVDVAVAWAAAIASPLELGSYGAASQEDRAWWSRHAPAAVIAENPTFLHAQSGLGVRYQALGLAGDIRVSVDLGRLPPDPRSRPWDQVLRVQAGWPLSGLEGACWYATPSPSIGVPVSRPQRAAPSDAIVVEQQTGSGKRFALLPLRPLWPGFAVNTALYTGAFWLLLGAPGAARWYVRRMRDRCAACGYPAGVSAICTECGRPRRRHAFAGGPPG